MSASVHRGFSVILCLSVVLRHMSPTLGCHGLVLCTNRHHQGQQGSVRWPRGRQGKGAGLKVVGDTKCTYGRFITSFEGAQHSMKVRFVTPGPRLRKSA